MMVRRLLMIMGGLLMGSCVRLSVTIPMESCLNVSPVLEQHVRTATDAMREGKDVRVAWLERQLRQDFPHHSPPWIRTTARRVWDLARARAHDREGSDSECVAEPAEEEV